VGSGYVCEGKRGTPRLKPPFPVQAGYLGKPTCVNNVETFAAATRVIEEGAEWFRRMGTPDSAGVRLLSIAGDCDRPGVYEVEWGVTLDEVLAMAGAHDARAVQISGPSGECLSVEEDGRRRIAYEDIPCNGAVTIFVSQHRPGAVGPPELHGHVGSARERWTERVGPRFLSRARDHQRVQIELQVIAVISGASLVVHSIGEELV